MRADCSNMQRFCVGMSIVAHSGLFDLRRRPHVRNHLQRVGEPNESDEEGQAGKRGDALPLAGKGMQTACEIQVGIDQYGNARREQRKADSRYGAATAASSMGMGTRPNDNSSAASNAGCGLDRQRSSTAIARIASAYQASSGAPAARNCGSGSAANQSIVSHSNNEKRARQMSRAVDGPAAGGTAAQAPQLQQQGETGSRRCCGTQVIHGEMIACRTKCCARPALRRMMSKHAIGGFHES